MTYISSILHLINELCNDLSQYYHDMAHQTINKQGNRLEAKRLLALSSKCREILLDNTEKKIQYYADILETQKSEDLIRTDINCE